MKKLDQQSLCRNHHERNIRQSSGLSDETGDRETSPDSRMLIDHCIALISQPLTSECVHENTNE